MTRLRSRGGLHRAAFPKRVNAWELGPGMSLIETAAQSVTTSTTIVVGDGLTPASDPLTLVRTHGSLELSLKSVGAIDGGFSWAAGIGIVTLDAFAIGVTAMPNPFDDLTWSGWLWHEMGQMHTAVGALAVGDPSTNPLVVKIDSKSMRKLKLNEVLFVSVQVGEVGTAVMNIRAFTRMLFKIA